MQLLRLLFRPAGLAAVECPHSLLTQHLHTLFTFLHFENSFHNNLPGGVLVSSHSGPLRQNLSSSWLAFSSQHGPNLDMRNLQASLPKSNRQSDKLKMQQSVLSGSAARDVCQSLGQALSASRSDAGKLWPMANSGLLPGFSNKVLLKHSHMHLFMYVCGCLCTAT